MIESSYEFKVRDRVIVNNKYPGEIVNISDYREPCMKYAIQLDDYHDDLVFVGEWSLTGGTDERG